MSVNEVTIRALLVVGLAVVALALAGWRKTARAQTRLRRIADERAAAGIAPQPVHRRPIEVKQAPTGAYHSPAPARRVGALIGSAGLVVVVGAALATLIAFGVAISITVLTDLLEQ